jgi:hypothetical protein
MQTSYSVDQKAGSEGLKYDLGHSDVVTKNNDTEKLLIGKLVSKGGEELEAKAPVASTDITADALGVVLASHDMESTDETLPSLPVGKPANVLKKGRVWVKVESAVDYGQAVHVRYAGAGAKGAFRGAAVADETAVLPGAKFLTSAGIGELAVLELNLV